MPRLYVMEVSCFAFRMLIPSIQAIASSTPEFEPFSVSTRSIARPRSHNVCIIRRFYRLLVHLLQSPASTNNSRPLKANLLLLKPPSPTNPHNLLAQSMTLVLRRPRRLKMFLRLVIILPLLHKRHLRHLLKRQSQPLLKLQLNRNLHRKNLLTDVCVGRGTCRLQALSNLF